MTKSLKSLAAIALLALTGVSQAIAQVPAALEGKITAITRDAISGAASMTVIGVPIYVSATTPIKTPTATLSTTQLVSATALPGIPATNDSAFVNGTAIVNGTWNAAANRLDATDVFVEPAENILLGLVTANNAGELQINGVRVVPIPTTELRMPSLPMRNEAGIPVIPSSVPVGAQAAAEGYYAGGVFNAFIIDVSAGTAAVKTSQVSILRAQGRERTPNATRGDELDIRGGSSTFNSLGNPVLANQTIDIFRIDLINGVTTATRIGSTTTVADPLNPGMATWRFIGTTTPSNNAILGTCPKLIRAVNRAVTTASAEAPVELL